MVSLTKDKEQGRNDICACGSGLKYKKCCGKLLAKNLTLRDMMKCLYLILQGASRENLAFHKGPIPFSKKMLNDAPDDIISEILVAEKRGYLVLTVKKKKEPLIAAASTKDVIALRKKQGL